MENQGFALAGRWPLKGPLLPPRSVDEAHHFRVRGQRHLQDLVVAGLRDLHEAHPGGSLLEKDCAGL